MLASHNEAGDVGKLGAYLLAQAETMLRCGRTVIPDLEEVLRAAEGVQAGVRETVVLSVDST